MLLVVATLAVACGQKPGVHPGATGGSEADGSPVGGSDSSIETAIGEVVGPSAPGVLDPSSGPDTDGPGSFPRPGRTTGEGTDLGNPSPGHADSNDAPGDRDPLGHARTVGGDTTGVTDDQIVIGIHAPITGGAPIRQDSFDRGRQLYWDHGDRRNPVIVHGRRVRVILADDAYNPSTARSECRRMAEKEKAFLLVGGAGADQIKACAEYAASVGIPYLSNGVTEIGLGVLGNYFGISMSYPAQAPLLAQYVRKTFPGVRRVAIMANDTRNFDDATNALQRAFPGSTVFRPAKNGRGTEFADEVCNATTKKFDAVIPLTSATFFLELEGSAACNPQYVGLGLTMGIDDVASVGCQTATGSMEGARFFSPFYSYYDAGIRNPDFIEAGGTDDIQFGLWGINRTVHALLEKVGPNPTREAFIRAARDQAITTGIYPDLDFQGGKRWGANQVHVVRAYCRGGGHYRTEAFFKSSF